MKRLRSEQVSLAVRCCFRHSVKRSFISYDQCCLTLVCKEAPPECTGCWLPACLLLLRCRLTLVAAAAAGRTGLQTATLWLVPTGLLLLVLVAFSSAGSRDAALSLMRLKGGGSSSSTLDEEALWVNDVPAEELVDIVQSSHTASGCRE